MRCHRGAENETCATCFFNFRGRCSFSENLFGMGHFSMLYFCIEWEIVKSFQMFPFSWRATTLAENVCFCSFENVFFCSLFFVLHAAYLHDG